MLIVYSYRDDVIVCTKKKEDEVIESFFGDDNGRNLEDYDREEIDRDIVGLETVIRTY